jgi:hypothetical protein
VATAQNELIVERRVPPRLAVAESA